MSNHNTCGECKHFDRVLGICDLTDDFSTVISNTLACVDFEICPKPTNGDVIRQMSNAELAKVLTVHNCRRCIHYNRNSGSCTAPIDKPCNDGILAWLNAPADCVKQKAVDNTQTDLCKANNTES